MTRPARPTSRRAWPVAWGLAAGVMAVAAVRAPGAASDVRAVASHMGGLRMAWLAVAVTAQVMALASGTAAQRQLLNAGGTRLRWRTVFALVLASTGLARVMPAGPVTGGAWQVREYRRRGAGTGLGVWAVLLGGISSAVVTLALLLAGAAVAGVGSLPLLAGAAVLLAGGAAALFAGAHRAHALSRWLSRRPHRSHTTARLAAAMSSLSRQRAGLGSTAGVLAYTGTGLLADAGVLAACFGLTGLPVPWRGVLFAYAAGQMAGRFVPLPGGMGGVEGGALGALILSGIAPGAAAAAVILYRVVGYWAVGAAGIAVAATLARRSRAAQAGTLPGYLLHRPGGTVVPVPPPKIPPPKVHHRLTPGRGPGS